MLRGSNGERPTFRTRTSSDWRAIFAALAAILVIDGDTVEQAGVRWRLVGLDAPEIHGARCAEERRRGIIAAARLITLLEQHGGTLERSAERRRDKYGRALGRLTIGGEDWASIAIREQLAVPFSGHGRRHDWCA